MYVLGTFLYLWLMVGFVVGTLTLLGPVRWVTGRFRTEGWSGESAAVIAIILALIAGTLLLTRWLLRRTILARHRWVRVGIPLTTTVLALLTTWAWMNPGTVIRLEQDGIERIALGEGAQFVFGPYPDAERLEDLEDDGFTAVISLLHPAVVPFEPKLLADERPAVERAGLTFVHAPMLPWVGNNEASLRKIRELAESGEGRYYVHCYLGRDRVNVVKRVVQSVGETSTAVAGAQAARTLAERDEPFERGPVVRAARGVWVVPFPNDHELYGYILFGEAGHVVSLLDPAVPGQAEWQEHAELLMDEYAVPHTHLPLPADADSAATAAIADSVLRMPSPTVVVAPYTTPPDSAGVAARLIRAIEDRASQAPPARRRPVTAGRSS